MSQIDEKDLLPIPYVRDPLSPPKSVWNKYYNLFYRDLLEGLKRKDLVHKYQSELHPSLISRLYVRCISQIKATQISETINAEVLEHVAPILKENALLAATAANQALTSLTSSNEKIKALTPSEISSLSKISKEQLELSKLEKGEATKIVQVEHLKNNKEALTVLVESIKSDPVLTDADE